eukprot:TRINITY_DN392_c0_g1_i1.p1 TRINITY_DN392_c0_g1~~TRINITY_DN392_c0_g1_i1.p1  ORF type:complete len:328 (+),score=97.87 TRINITY_DN392_c0_g1_i1:101-1084(+)
MTTNKRIITALLLIAYAANSQQQTLCNGTNGGVWSPSPGMPWLWQIGSTPSSSDIDTTNAQAIDLDLFNTPVSLIDYIHSKGKAVICYIDTAYEPNRPDSSDFTSTVKGDKLDGWPGQTWVDIKSDVVRNIMVSRVKLAQEKGCDAVEWDDVDAYANKNGLDLTYNDQINFNIFLVNITHNLGLSVGLKNDLGQVNDLVNYYDWALNEQCFQMQECDPLSAFINQNKAVFGTEYKEDKQSAAKFCPIQNSQHFSWLLSDLALDGKSVTQCCSYETPSCAPVSFNCTQPPSVALSFLPSTSSSSSSLLPPSSSLFVVFMISSFFYIFA